MTRPRVHQKQPCPERDLARFERRTLEQQRVPGFREGSDRLVHHATAHPHMVGLCPERDPRDLASRELRARETRERLGRRHGECRRRRESGPHRDLRGNRNPRTATRWQRLRRPQLTQNAREVSGPAVGELVLPTHARDLAVARRDSLEHSFFSGPDGGGGTFRDRDRQHGTTVVVGVLADQMHATGGRRRRAGRRAEGCVKQSYRGTWHQFDKGWRQCYRMPAGFTISPSFFPETHVCGGLCYCCAPESPRSWPPKGSASTSTTPAPWRAPALRPRTPAPTGRASSSARRASPASPGPISAPASH